MVPGSTLMYGSSLHMVTRRPRHLRSRPSEEAVRPLPSELETPPVTKMNLLTPPAGRRTSSQLLVAPFHDNRPNPPMWRTSGRAGPAPRSRRGRDGRHLRRGQPILAVL